METNDYYDEKKTIDLIIALNDYLQWIYEKEVLYAGTNWIKKNQC